MTEVYDQFVDDLVLVIVLKFYLCMSLVSHVVILSLAYHPISSRSTSDNLGALSVISLEARALDADTTDLVSSEKEFTKIPSLSNCFSKIKETIV